MRFEILGPLRVVDGDTELPLGGPRPQAVLGALLVAAPNQLSVDQLIDEVWGDQPPETAAHVVRTYVSNLRRMLDHRIKSDGRNYGLDIADDQVDAEEFALLIRSADGAAGPAQASDLLARALELWRGRPFGDLADGSRLLAARAAELEELRLRAIELAVDADLEMGRGAHWIPGLESLIVDNPFRERLHHRLMLALYRDGRQADALRVGWNLRSRLVEELGVEPSPATRDLEDRILMQDAGLDLAPPNNIPVFLTSFLGRGLEIGEVTKLLGDSRLVSILGAGGVGKTRLGREVAHRMLGRFPGGVWWIDLSAPGVEVPARVAAVVGLAGQPGLTSKEMVKRFFARREALLVLDNCEHMVRDVAAVALDLLASAPAMRILVTSRRALEVAGEVRFEVPPLSLPLGTLGASESERLFLERSGDVDGAFLVNQETVGDVAEICRALDGIPLAIEMAAGRTSALSPAQIAAHLAERLDFLKAGEGAPTRQRSLVATMDWSYDLLTPSQRALFDRLSVFAGPFDLAACEAVAGRPVVDDLGTLVDASMVARSRSSEGAVTFRLLDTMRAYGREHLNHGAGFEAAAEDHARYFLDRVERSAPLAFTAQHPAAMAEIGAVNDDVVAALEWSLGHGGRSRAPAAAPGLVHYWFWRGDPSSAYRFGRRLLEAEDPGSPDEVAAAHLCSGFGATLLGESEQAVEHMGQARALLEGGEDWRLLLWAFNGIGQGAVFAGAPSVSAQMGNQILDLCRHRDLDLPRGYGLALLGEAEFFGDGDFDAARGHLSQAIPLLRALGDEAALNMFALGILAGVASLQMDYGAAEEAAVEASTLGGPGWSATALIILGGFVLHPKGETARAESVVKAGLIRVHERSMDVWVRTALLLLSRIAAGKGDWEDSARLIGGCRSHLPPWAQHRRWWNHEPLVRAELGEDDYARITAIAAGEPLDRLVAWATGALQA